MAVYKVPQNVEAEDKLIGPFGFRQFVYLGIAGGSGFIGYLLFQIHPLLVIIPVPIIIFFVVLSLPLRKEQPMETYLLALLRFYLKPKSRLWNPDGTITYVEIIVPKVIGQKLSKDITSQTATEQLDYLARVMDSRGWSLKGQTAPTENLTETVAAEAASIKDVLDDDAAIGQRFATKIAQNDQQRRQHAVDSMKQASQQQPQQNNTPVSDTAQPQTNSATTQPQEDTTIAPQYNPYPNAIHQRIINPIGSQPATTPQNPPANAMPDAVSPDIIRLAHNDDLSISAIAHEAHRLTDKDEVVIKLH